MRVYLTDSDTKHGHSVKSRTKLQHYIFITINLAKEINKNNRAKAWSVYSYHVKSKHVVSCQQSWEQNGARNCPNLTCAVYRIRGILSATTKKHSRRRSDIGVEQLLRKSDVNEQEKIIINHQFPITV